MRVSKYCGMTLITRNREMTHRIKKTFFKLPKKDEMPLGRVELVVVLLDRDDLRNHFAMKLFLRKSCAAPSTEYSTLKGSKDDILIFDE